VGCRCGDGQEPRGEGRRRQVPLRLAHALHDPARTSWPRRLQALGIEHPARWRPGVAGWLWWGSRRQALGRNADDVEPCRLVRSVPPIALVDPDRETAPCVGQSARKRKPAAWPETGGARVLQYAAESPHLLNGDRAGVPVVVGAMGVPSPMSTGGVGDDRTRAGVPCRIPIHAPTVGAECQVGAAMDIDVEGGDHIRTGPRPRTALAR